MDNIDKALSLKLVLDDIRPLSSEDEQRVMQKFKLDWNYHSNHLEGNSLSYGETKALLLFGITAQGKPLKDHFEIKGHNEAITLVLDVVNENRPITENFIRELHSLLLKESYEVDAITPDGKPTKKLVSVGEYKTTPNHVKTKTGEIFRFATPEETPALMSDLISWYREKSIDPKSNPIRLAAWFHYKFIQIHPFDDGNGRTARILMNFILMKFGYPPTIIKTQQREEYFSVLRQADAGLIEPFINFITTSLIQSLELMIKASKGDSIEEDDDIEKEIILLDIKLNNIGKEISITKSIESVKQAADNSISLLLKYFVERCSLFDKYYLERSLTTIIRSLGYSTSFDEPLEVFYNNLEAGLDGVNFIYEHLELKNTALAGMGFKAQLFVSFEKYSYDVIYKENVILTKLYNEILSEDEIALIVKPILIEHKNQIENSIRDYNDNE